MKPKSILQKLILLCTVLLSFTTASYAYGSEKVIDLTYQGVNYGTVTLTGWLDSGQADFELCGEDTVKTWTYQDVSENSKCFIEPSNFGGYMYLDLAAYNICDDGYELYEDWCLTQLYADGQALVGIGTFPYDDEHKKYFSCPGHPASFTFGRNDITMPIYEWDTTFTLTPDDTLSVLRIYVYDESGIFLVRCTIPCFIKSDPNGSSDTSTTIADGICGDDLTWRLNDEGLLTIEGTGPMYDYSEDSPAPWFSLREDIYEVNFGDGITSVGAYSFYMMDYLWSAHLPDTIESIGTRSFAETFITSITIPDAVTYIEPFTFEYCIDLKTVDLGPYVTAIGEEAFSNCYSLSEINFSNNLVEIENYAFLACSSMTSLVIPDSVDAICCGAFQDCHALTQITLGSGLTYIDYNAFCLSHGEYAGKHTVTFTGTATQWNSIDMDHDDPIWDSVTFSGTDPVWSVTTGDISSEAVTVSDILDTISAGEEISIEITETDDSTHTELMLAAIYDRNGRMIELRMVPVTFSGSTFTADLSFTKGCRPYSMSLLLADADFAPTASKWHVKI